MSSRASNDAPLATPREEQPKPQKPRANKTAAKKSKAAGVSEKAMERAHALVENRPDLVEAHPSQTAPAP